MTLLKQVINITSTFYVSTRIYGINDCFVNHKCAENVKVSIIY